MAHEIEIIAGKAQMAFSGQECWHKLGQRVADNLTPKEMMQAAGVDWRVATLPTFAHLQVGSETKFLDTGMKALVRETDGRVLTQVGQNWNPVQNEEAFEFFDSFVKAGSMKMHTAGSLKNGEIVWALAKVDDDFELFNGDKVESYLLFSNPHQYGKSIDVKFVKTRVVCQNTLAISLNEKGTTGVRLNHRRKFNGDELKVVMGFSEKATIKFKEAAIHLISKRTTADTVKQYFGELIGYKENTKDELTTTGKNMMTCVDTQPGAELGAGTWWQIFNSVTYSADHVLGRNVDTRLQSSWYGANSKLKLKALELALEYSNK